MKSLAERATKPKNVPLLGSTSIPPLPSLPPLQGAASIAALIYRYLQGCKTRGFDGILIPDPLCSSWLVQTRRSQAKLSGPEGAQ